MGLFPKRKKKVKDASTKGTESASMALQTHMVGKQQQYKLFWEAYHRDMERLLALDPHVAVEQTNALLKKYVPEVYAEYEKDEHGAFRRLVITADGILAHFGDVMQLVQLAPKLAGVEVVAFRQRANATQFGINMGDISLQSSEVWVRPRPKQGRISLEFAWGKDIPEDLQDGAKKLSLILMDHILGEYDAVVKVCYIDFVDNLPKEGAREGWSSLSELPPVFDAIWSGTLGHTQRFPVSNDNWTSFEASRQEDEADVLVGMFNDAARSLACRADMGIRLDVQVQVPEQETLERIYAYEEQLDSMLSTRQLGLHVLSLFPLRERARTMTWYVCDELTALQAAERAAERFPDLEMTFSTTYDPSWESYLAWVRD